VKLLLDQNISRRLLPALELAFPASTQVQLLGLQTAQDAAIWRFALDEGFAIVTKDSDFVEMSALHGFPPKIIWLNVGNVSNTVIRDKLVEQLASIQQFLDSNDDGVFEIE
jgi:predicted nuclease of predicted toxin-antitoxin system